MKIFCLGMHKTGTLSLAHALEELGYRVRHGYKAQSDAIQNALYDGKKPLDYVEEELGEHNAYLDIYAVRWFYPKMDEAYPDSRFILTTRDNDDWLASVHRQMKKRPQQESPWFHYWYHQTDNQRIMDKTSSEYEIRYYFADRGDFMEINLIENSGKENWAYLCQFLDKPIPDVEFPHANKSPKS